MQERLNKLIAQAGIASRRQAEEMIKSGIVSVNGEIVTELGTKADPETDHIKVSGKLINARLKTREKAYILLNKPKGYLSSAADPEGRNLVTDLVRGYGKLHPVGRLDYNTEGLLILTNDGEFTNYIAASKKIAKLYEVKVKGLPNANAINKLRRGIQLEDGFKTAPAQITELKHTENNGWYEVTLYEGHNQQIRKMFDAIGHSVVKLRRIAIGHVKDDKIPIGAYRELDEKEIREFTNPSAAKPAKKPAEAKPEGAKPRPNSRAVAAKKPKPTKNFGKAEKTQIGKAPLKDKFKSKLSAAGIDKSERSVKSLSSDAPKRKSFKKTSSAVESPFSKFKKSSVRKPKR